ncbi:Hypothetical predicted protein [Paramuricea clavata]|uniref:Uncharacterized protein n=1 Tax=Paramuricea clavata TaxID=317549 RepID=A0A6S7HUV5_PARCT|nr:Hypothetical predicted protein [Paramuricea clavata]
MQNNEIGEEHHLEPQNDAKKKYLAFTLCRYLGKIITLPNWTGFNTKLIYKRDIPTQSKIGYLPIIYASPTELSTVKEILNQSEKIADKLNLKYMCLVFDEAIYAKVQQIRWKEEGYLSRFIVRLGDFHMAMPYCGAISKLFKDTGQKDETITLIENLAAKFPCEEYLTEVISEDFEQLRMAVAMFAQSEAEKKPTFALWLNYIEMVQVLLIFLRATGENNWDQHLSAVRSTLP